MTVPPQVTDGSRVVAVCSPYHNGDVLWAVPTARALAARHDAKVDFWVSAWGERCRDLLEAQSFCRRVVVDPEHPLGREWHMGNAESPDHGYLAVYQLGFRGAFSVPIPEYYATLCGLGQQPNVFDVPPGPWRDLPEGDFVCLATKGPADSFAGTFRAFAGLALRQGFPVAEVGYPGCTVAADLGALDRTSEGFCEMAHVISKCRWFVGLLSSPLVVASGFGCVKVGVHDGLHWDLSQVVHTPLHRYVVGLGRPELVLEWIR